MPCRCVIAVAWWGVGDCGAAGHVCGLWALWQEDKCDGEAESKDPNGVVEERNIYSWDGNAVLTF